MKNQTPEKITQTISHRRGLNLRKMKTIPTPRTRIDIPLRDDSKEFLTKDLQKAEHIAKLVQRDDNEVWQRQETPPLPSYKPRSNEKSPKWSIASLYAFGRGILP